MCDIGGDAGLEEMTPFIGKLQLQVLGFEYCDLTDKSIPYISSIIKVISELL
jgi:hypothetical protein